MNGRVWLRLSQCGACTVSMDDKACDPAACPSALGWNRKITTLEDWEMSTIRTGCKRPLSRSRQRKRLLHERHIMTAQSYDSTRQPNPSERRLRRALNGNLVPLAAVTCAF